MVAKWTSGYFYINTTIIVGTLGVGRVCKEDYCPISAEWCGEYGYSPPICAEFITFTSLKKGKLQAASWSDEFRSELMFGVKD